MFSGILVALIGDFEVNEERGEFVQERKPADVLKIMEPFKPHTTGEIEDNIWIRGICRYSS